MKVAIVGAGIAGLSCAYELKKNGIVPTIFDEKAYLHQAVDFNTCTLKLFDRHISDPMKFLKKEYNLNIHPLNPLKEIVMNSPNKQTIVRGNLGYILNRGEDKQSLENQIASNTNLPVIFNKHVDVEDIRKDFDYVVVATGKADTAKQMNIFTPVFNAFARISVISGEFKTDSLKMWVNTEYSKSCFVFQLAHSPQKACLAIIVNDIIASELDYYWERFIKIEGISNVIIKTNDVQHELGYINPPKVGNVYFVGKAGGFIDCIFGFGMLSGIESGIFAARSIAKNIKYKKLLKPIIKDLKRKEEFRKAQNSFDNWGYDRLVQFLGFPGVKQLIYNNPLAKISRATFIAKIYNKFT